MRRLLSSVRGLIGNDGAAAFRAEKAELSAALSVPAVDPRFAEEMRRSAGSPRRIVLGTAVAEPSISVSLPVESFTGTGHALVLGGSGAGKSRLVAGIAVDLLRRVARGEPLGIWIVDHKSELVALVQKLLVDLIESLPRSERDRLLRKLVVFNPFSTTSLVPFQILERDPSVPPEVQAHDVTTIIDRMGGAALGVRQDHVTFNLVLLGISKGLSLPEVAALLDNPAALAATAATCPYTEVRSFFGGGVRLAAGSLDGVRARLNRLLRLPSTRLMLGARGSVSFPALMREKIVLADLGSPPLGSEDIGRFWAGLFTMKTARAIFERTEADVMRPVCLVVDEWQEGVGAGGDIGESYERVLSMARSRGVSLVLCTQSLAIASRVSPTLPKVVATNTDVQMLFRPSREDAREMADILPVTGRRRRPRPAPWEERARSPYLTPPEEREALIADAVNLARREFFLWNRGRPYKAHLVRTKDVAPREGTHVAPEVARLIREGTLARPIAELEAPGRGNAVFADVEVPVHADPMSVPPRPRRPRGT